MVDIFEDDNIILSRLRSEFIDITRDQLDDINIKLDDFETGEANAEDILLYVQREIHNIKGQGATYGFPLTGRVAHMLEDYLINADGISTNNVIHIRNYLDLMINFVSLGEPHDENEIQNLLNALPTGRIAKFSTQKSHSINVLLVMPSGTQRKMVAKELISCGFRVMRAYDCNQALAVAVDIVPDIVFMNYDMTPFSGRELCNVFAAVDKLRAVHIVLLTSYEAGNQNIQNLPPAVSIVQKQKNFLEVIGELMIEWGIFGTTSK